jgi:hypothetical protein
MLKKLFWFCLILAAIAVGWVMLVEGHGSAFYWHTHPFAWHVRPIEGLIEVVVGTAALFLTAIVLIAVFAGVGFVVFGTLILVGLILLFATLPLTWPIIVLLLIIGMFCALVRGCKSG